MEDGGAGRERRKGIAKRNEEESQRKDDGPAASHRPPHQRPRLLCIPIGTYSQSHRRVGQHLPPARALAHRIRPVCPPTRMPVRLTRARTPATPHPERTLAESPFLCARSNVSPAPNACPPPRTSVAPPHPPLPRAANFPKRKSATHLVKKRERPL
ncbi:hypothetical protein B0H14DRAFT_2956379, partial [Mycena olivaceomarginata]